MIRKSRITLVLPLFMLLALGCNTSNTPCNVSGKITYKGETVPTGSIQFYLADSGKGTEGGKGMYSWAFRDGAYSGSELPVGEYVVTVETESANPNKAQAKKVQPGGGGKKDDNSDYQQRMMDRGAFNGPTNTGPYVQIPAKYGDQKKTTLKATLTKGSNTINFDLTD
jgi:hypothetical protein